MAESRLPVVRMQLTAARMALFLDATERPEEAPMVERAASLVDEALMVLDPSGRDVRGAPPEDWQAA